MPLVAVPDPSPPMHTSLPTQRAHLRADAIAVRYKERGLWRVLSWPELALLCTPGDGQDVSRSAPDAASRAQSADGQTTRQLGRTWLSRTLREADLSLPARPSDERAPVLRTDLLWLEPADDAPEVRARFLRHWLESGAELGVGEALDTCARDRRELGPSLIVARASWYDALHADVSERAGHGSHLRRALLGWALGLGREPARHKTVRGALATALVLGALSDQLGLSRVRLALSLGDVGEPARALFAALGVVLRRLDDDTAGQAIESTPRAAHENARVFAAEQGGVRA